MSMRRGRNLSVNNLQQTREALGWRLRELRRDADLTGYVLAERLRWPQSKVSKIETGRQTPTESDIRAWAEATGRGDVADELVATVQTLETMYADWRRQLRGGLRARQQSFADVEARAASLRVFECTFVPGLLQTPEYARALITESIEFYQVPDDADAAVQARMQRQQVLYRVDKEFFFVITEAVLRYRFCPPEVLVGQLDRLMTLSSLRNVKFGIIPFEAEYRFSPPHGFWIFDDDMVLIETISAELTLTQPQEISQHLKAFDRLAAAAVYGSAARRIVMRALEEHELKD
jgi:transcriptional regulator with XRE-family HTH domain